MEYKIFGITKTYKYHYTLCNSSSESRSATLHIHSAGSDGERLIAIINNLTRKWNKDNISRTKAYLHFYRRHPEVKWAFLASMVSRNAGWNMCDLESPLYKKALDRPYRQALFMAYEKANYLIFRDAFPQLLLYHYSTYLKSNLFHYLRIFSVSSFMESEWNLFWDERDEERLMESLIINEQNLIQEPVIKDGFLMEEVFGSKLFNIQDQLGLSVVAFPARTGKLYGALVRNFKNLDARIRFGISLGKILFSPVLYPSFSAFASATEHTGSRRDYERFIGNGMNSSTPFLRLIYPAIDHPDYSLGQWDERRKIKKSWREAGTPIDGCDITRDYLDKRRRIGMFLAIKACFN